jgi:hypothetical protein
MAGTTFTPPLADAKGVVVRHAMSIWVRALCTRPVGSLTPESLHRGIADRLPALAAYYGEDGALDTVARLRVEMAAAGSSATSVWLLRYHEDPTHAIQAVCRTDPAAVAAEVSALRAGLDACDEEGVDEVRDVLDRVTEAVGLELSMSDVEGIGWPVAIAAAACFALPGEGLIQADGEGWMRARGRGVDQVIDGD